MTDGADIERDMTPEEIAEADMWLDEIMYNETSPEPLPERTPEERAVIARRNARFEALFKGETE